MRTVIVSDPKAEHTLLKEHLSQQLAFRGMEADILGFEDDEAFLAAGRERRFSTVFLGVYMEGLSGMDATKELRKADTDCLLTFTTTSVDCTPEGFQVRALHYLVKSFSEEKLFGLPTEVLAKLPHPEPVLTAKVSGSDVRSCYRNIISIEHFTHRTNIRTTAEEALATRQSFKTFTEPLKEDPCLFACGHGTIVDLEYAADFQGAAFCMIDGSHVYVNQELLRPARQAFTEFLLQGERMG